MSNFDLGEFSQGAWIHWGNSIQCSNCGYTLYTTPNNGFYSIPLPLICPNCKCFMQQKDIFSIL